MAQARQQQESEPKAAAEPKAPEVKGRAMPAGDGPVEFKLRKKIPLPEAGRVVKEAWIGRVCGRSVRVYRGAQEETLPDAVKQAVLASGIEIGIVTWEELGVLPQTQGQPAFVNLTQQQLAKATAAS